MNIESYPTVSTVGIKLLNILGVAADSIIAMDLFWDELHVIVLLSNNLCIEFKYSL